MLDIITIGSATRDVFLKSEGFEMRRHADSPTGIEQCFPLGSKIEIKEAVFTTGGGGTNTAVTFARQGLKTACVSIIGEDFNGREILEELKNEKVDTKFFQKHRDDKTAYSVILVYPDAERTILSYKGEGQHFNAEKVQFNKLRTRWLFLDSLGGHYNLLEKAVLWAKKNNVQIAANPGGKELVHGLEKLKMLFENSGIVIMNKEEAAGLSGIDYGREEEILKFMDGRIKGIFIMTKGPEGIIASDGENIYRAGVPDSPVVERTGAGDAWSSGFVAEYIKETRDKGQATSDDIVKAVQFATANASSVVMQFGAKAGILHKGDYGPWKLVEVKISPL